MKTMEKTNACMFVLLFSKPKVLGKGDDSFDDKYEEVLL